MSAFLIRSRTGLGVLLRALDGDTNAADVSKHPHRLAGGSLYFDTQEVQGSAQLSARD